MAQPQPALHALVRPASPGRPAIPATRFRPGREVPSLLWRERTVSDDRDFEALTGATMPRLADPQYLRDFQYADERHLDARIQIHRRFSTNPYGWFCWVFDSLLS